MSQDVLFAAAGGLLHDIGKLVQRTEMKSNLSDSELQVVPMDKTHGFYHHLHAGYTSRFIQEQLGIYDSFEKDVSEHHLTQSPGSFAALIQEADRLASKIDRSDEQSDKDETNKKGKFKQVRMSSIFSLIDFGKRIQEAQIGLNPLSLENFPTSQEQEKTLKEAVEEYCKLYNQLLASLKDGSFQRGKINRKNFDRLYALFFEYTSCVPASTFEGGRTYVSLFDHLKLSAAIASCLAVSNSDQFRMLEFDISGIQNFIFQVAEGSETKKGIARSLRGRSLLISLITDYITYSYLNVFGLTQANIIFQSGGGALLLLPDTSDFDEKIEALTIQLQKDLMDLFSTSITFVQASVTVGKDELKDFKEEKAIQLKCALEDQKAHKYLNLLEDGFFVQKAEGNKICKMCQQLFCEDDYCKTCKEIEKISRFYIKHKELCIIFNLEGSNCHPKDEYEEIHIGSGSILLMTKEELNHLPEYPDYVESVNSPYLGIVRYLANMAPERDGELLSLEEIADSLSPEYGDAKLGILKMDVDNLGAVFAYGLPKNQETLKKTRSLSKYLTLSRMIEVFFGKNLPEICQKVSQEMIGDNWSPSDNGTLFYINYAGGDDLVIFGPAAGILRLAQEIDQSFYRYTFNQNLTISGGIYIQKPKEPIRFGIQRAEEYLDQSKELDGKHGITLIDTTLSFSEYDQVLQQAARYRQSINHKTISRSHFYTLMMMLNTDRYRDLCRRIPLFFYSVTRNIADKAIKKEWIKTATLISSSDSQAVRKEREKVVLEMKLAIMQTREV